MNADRKQLLRRCVALRCRELGLSQRSVLKMAGLTYDTLARSPRYGHRTDILEKLASAVGWTLPQLLANSDALRDKPDRLPRSACAVCGRELDELLTCWSRSDASFAQLPLHLGCAQSIATALMLRARGKIQRQPATNGAARSPVGIDLGHAPEVAP